MNFRRLKTFRQRRSTCSDAISARYQCFIDLVRHPRGRISDRIKEVGEQNICTSTVVAAELRYGAAKRERRG
jgi:hypothetical protein